MNSLLCRHPRYLRTCALMYAIFKSDLNTPHVELPRMGRDDTAEWEPLPTFSALHPIQCKCPLNPVNPLLLHGGAQQESEEARGNCDMVPPPPRWEAIQETSARGARQLAVTLIRQQLKYKEEEEEEKTNVVGDPQRVNLKCSAGGKRKVSANKLQPVLCLN